MSDPEMPLSEISSFHAIDARLATAGQPTQEQLHTLREAGFEAVINLALVTSDHALPDEREIVEGLGLPYVHIPVDFGQPTTEDFRAFCDAMEGFKDRVVFVHCAANMRVSAFVFLYRVLRRAVPIAEAQRDLHRIWHPNEVWSQFIDDQIRTKETTEHS